MVRGASAALRHIARELRPNDDREDSPPRQRRSRRPAYSGTLSNTASGDEASSSQGPRIFPADVKKECWNRAEEVAGRDPERWRRDVAGNLVSRRLNSCQGCLCYDFDHIVPYSKGGPSTVENCQVLQTKANNAKGGRLNVSRTELQQRSVNCVMSRRDMDAIELATYGDVRHTKEDRGCRLQ